MATSRNELGLRPARAEDLPAVRSMLQLYLHDLSGLVGPDVLPLGPDGRFDWGADPAVYLTESDLEGCGVWLLYVGPALAGFALVRDRRRVDGGGGRCLDIVFVARAWRRRGLALQACRRLVRGLGGRWVFSQLGENEAGMKLALRGLFAEVGEDFESRFTSHDGRVEVHQEASFGEPLGVTGC